MIARIGLGALLLGVALPLGADPGAPKPLAGRDPFAEPRVLPVEQAFAFSARLRGDRLLARWRMPAGYYLYRHRFGLEAGEGVALGALAIPPGKPIVDAAFGEAEAHYGEVEISARVLEHAGVVVARIRYQGCAESGFCYPPQERDVALPASGEGRERRRAPARP